MLTFALPNISMMDAPSYCSSSNSCMLMSSFSISRPINRQFTVKRPLCSVGLISKMTFLNSVCVSPSICFSTPFSCNFNAEYFNVILDLSLSCVFFCIARYARRELQIITTISVLVPEYCLRGSPKIIDLLHDM